MRFGDKRLKYQVGEEVAITIGWSVKKSRFLCRARRTEMIYKRIKDLTTQDLQGVSPDCTTKEAIPYVLTLIYHHMVTPENYVTVIRWRYL